FPVRAGSASRTRRAAATAASSWLTRPVSQRRRPCDTRPVTSPTVPSPSDSVLVRAARQQPVPHTPVWFMRQAGRSLPEYRAIREGVGMLESCRTPELVAEITLQPVRRHGVDAAMFFSDIVVPLMAVGLDLDIVAG